MNLNIKTAPSGTSPFDSIRRIENNIEFWTGRELMPLLGYEKWQRFGAKEPGSNRVSVVCRAIISCNTSGNVVEDNFTHLPMRVNSMESVVSDMIPEDWKLSRFACYLVAMNGDVTKPEIAAAQAYFAIKTREAELLAKPEVFVEGIGMLASHERRLVQVEASDKRKDAQIAELQAVNAQLIALVGRLTDRVEMLSGKRRSSEELRYAISQILDDPERGHLSNVAIGKIVGCTEGMVRKYKREILEAEINDILDDPDQSRWSNAEIAEVVGCSIELVRKVKDERNGIFPDDNAIELSVKLKLPRRR